MQAEYVPVADVAAFLSCSKRTALNFVRSHSIPCVDLTPKAKKRLLRYSLEAVKNAVCIASDASREDETVVPSRCRSVRLNGKSTAQVLKMLEREQ